MKKKTDTPVDCYISAFRNTSMDPVLEREGFAPGMVTFAIPSLGILFKCRADGSAIDLEFGAFFSLLKFIKTSLKDEKITSIRVFSSDPGFVFAFTGNSSHLTKGSAREKLLREYAQGLSIAVGYIESYKNKTRVPPDTYPSLPTGMQSSLKPDPDDLKKSEFKPFQRGIKL